MPWPSHQRLDPWQLKPRWCRPWSILLTGAALVGGTWLLARSPWVTLLVAVPVAAWWWVFLILWPRAAAAYLRSNGEASPPES